MDHPVAAILYHSGLLARNVVLHPWEVFGCQVNLVVQAPFPQLGCYGVQCLRVGAPLVVYVCLGSHIVCLDQNIQAIIPLEKVLIARKTAWSSRALICIFCSSTDQRPPVRSSWHLAPQPDKDALVSITRLGGGCINRVELYVLAVLAHHRSSAWASSVRTTILWYCCLTSLCSA